MESDSGRWRFLSKSATRRDSRPKKTPIASTRRPSDLSLRRELDRGPLAMVISRACETLKVIAYSANAVPFLVIRVAYPISACRLARSFPTPRNFDFAVRKFWQHNDSGHKKIQAARNAKNLRNDELERAMGVAPTNIILLRPAAAFLPVIRNP